MNNSFHILTSRLGMGEEKTSELEDIWIETSKSKNQIEQRLTKSNRISKDWGTTTHVHTPNNCVSSVFANNHFLTKPLLNIKLLQLHRYLCEQFPCPWNYAASHGTRLCFRVLPIQVKGPPSMDANKRFLT